MPSQVLDNEKLFQLMAAKDWDQLSELLYRHRAILRSDLMLQQAARLFEGEFLGHVRGLPAKERVHRMRYITMIIASDRGRFAEPFWRAVIELKLQTLFDLNDPAFPGAAGDFIEDVPLAQELLRQAQRDRPEQMADARRSAMNIKAVAAPPAPKPARHVVSLFKSPQEQNFYEAMRMVFPHLLAYPNVAVSAVFDLARLHGKISSEAEEYFRRGPLFDCVVFDPKDYLPLHFFELDSSHHNTPDAIRRDRLKDEICKAAGVNLVRARAFEAKAVTVPAFVELIQELLILPKQA